LGLMKFQKSVEERDVQVNAKQNSEL